MSLGLSMTKSVLYSTMPRALTGASARSWITAFFGSAGSSSPRSTPVTFS